MSFLLDSTFKWYQMVLIFLCLIYSTQHGEASPWSRSIHVATNGIISFFLMANTPLYICTTSPLSIPLWMVSWNSWYHYVLTDLCVWSTSVSPWPHFLDEKRHHSWRWCSSHYGWRRSSGKMIATLQRSPMHQTPSHRKPTE